MAVSDVVAEAAVVAASVAEAAEDRVMVADAEAVSGARRRRFAKATCCEFRRRSID